MRARVSVLTVSDACARGEREDTSGERIAAWCEEIDAELVGRRLVRDETHEIVPALLAACDEDGADLVVSTGGTGLTPRDVTPEATRAVIDREAPGIAEEIRRQGTRSTPYAVLSRGLVGLRGRTLVVNLPGSSSGVEDGLRVLAPLVGHAVRMARGRDTAHAPGGERDS